MPANDSLIEEFPDLDAPAMPSSSIQEFPDEPSHGGYGTELARGLTQFVPATAKTAATLGLDRPLEVPLVRPVIERTLRALGVDTPAKPAEERPLYRAGEWMERKLEDAYPAVPEGERHLGHDVVRGLGQVASMIGPALGARAVLGLGARATGAVGTSLGFGQEFDDAYSRARQRGDDPDTALAKSLGYATVSALIENKLGAGRILRKYFPDPADAAKKLSALGVAKSVGTSLAVGFGEEGSQRFAQNWIVEGKPSLEGIVEEGAPGGIVQAIAEAPAMLLGRRGRVRASLSKTERDPDEAIPGPRVSVTQGEIKKTSSTSLIQSVAPAKFQDYEIAEMIALLDMPASEMTGDEIVRLWKYRKRAKKKDATETGVALRNKLKELEDSGVEVVDETGKDYDEGMAHEVIASVPVKGLSKKRIRETLSPTVRRKNPDGSWMLSKNAAIVIEVPEVEARIEQPEELKASPPSVTLASILAMTPAQYYDVSTQWSKEAMSESGGISPQIRAELAAKANPDLQAWQDAQAKASADFAALRTAVKADPALMGHSDFQKRFSGAAQRASFFSEGRAVLDKSKAFDPRTIALSPVATALPSATVKAATYPHDEQIIFEQLKQEGLTESQAARVMSGEKDIMHIVAENLKRFDQPSVQIPHLEALNEARNLAVERVVKLRDALFLIRSQNETNVILDTIRNERTAKPPSANAPIKDTGAAAGPPTNVSGEQPVAVKPGASRVTFNRGSVGDAVAAAKRLKADHSLYVFPTVEGMTIGKEKPPFGIQHIIVKPDGTHEAISAATSFEEGRKAGVEPQAPAKVAQPATKPVAPVAKMSPIGDKPTLLEYAKSKLTKETADRITSESQVESYRAQWEKDYPPTKTTATAAKASDVSEIEADISDTRARMDKLRAAYLSRQAKGVVTRANTTAFNAEMGRHAERVAELSTMLKSKRSAASDVSPKQSAKPDWGNVSVRTPELDKQATKEFAASWKRTEAAKAEQQKIKPSEVGFSFSAKNDYAKQQAIIDRETKLQEQLKLYGSKPAPSPSVAPAQKTAAWYEQESKESIFKAMRSIQDRVDAAGERERQLRAPQGSIAVGAAGFDEFIQSESQAEVLRAIRKGATPEQAEASAKQYTREAVSKHNAKRPKDVNWARDSGTADSYIERAVEELKKAAQKTAEPTVVKSETVETPGDLFPDLKGKAPTLERVRNAIVEAESDLKSKFESATAEDVPSESPLHDVADLAQKRVDKLRELGQRLEQESLTAAKRPEANIAEPAPNLGTGLAEGRGMSPDEARAAIAGESTGGFTVEVISKADAERLTGKSEARGYGGFFWKGKIYLVHENMARGDVAGAKKLLREEVGHGLLRTEEGGKQLQAVLDAGKLQLTEAEKQALRDQGYGEANLLDEFIAKSERDNPPWWKAAVEQVRVWLSKAGLANLSNEEVARLLLKQIRRANEGATSLADAALPELAANISDRSTINTLLSLGAGERLRNKYGAVDWERLVELGETENWREAGYIAPEGQLIDLSGKKEGGSRNERALDHRELGGTRGMIEAMAAGFIRISLTGGQASIDVAAKPSRIQKVRLFELMEESGGNVSLDLQRGTGKLSEHNQYESSRDDWSNTYDDADPQTVLDDIDAYYEGRRPGVGLPGIAPGQPTGSVEQEVRGSVTQVQGVQIGIARESENIAATQQIIRVNIFDGTQAVSDTATAKARAVFARMTDPSQKAAAVGEILSTTNAEMGPGLVLAELWRYAEKMVLTNSDDSFLREIVPHYQDFGLGEAGAGSTAFGRGLRALQETDTLFRQLYEIEKEKRAAAGREMAVGPELLEELLAALKGGVPDATALERKTRTVLGTKVEKAKADEIVRVIRRNPAAPVTELINHFANLAGFKLATPEQHRRLVEMAQKLSDPNLSIPERSELLDQMLSVLNTMKLPPSLLTRLASNLVATNLTGLRTLGVNIFSPNVQGLVELGLTGITSPRDFPAMLRGAIEGGKQWLSNIRYSMGRDAYSFLNNDYQAAQNVLKQIWQRGLVQIKSASVTERSRGLTNLIFGAQQYYMRLLNSVDNANGILRRQMQLALYSSQAMRRLGMSTAEIRDVADMFYLMRDQFYAQSIENGLTENQSNIRANALAYQEFVDFLNNELPADSMGRPVGSEISKAATYESTSVLGRLAEDVKEIDEGGLVTRTVGAPLLHLSNWMRQQEGLMPAIGVALLGYVNVPYRTARYYAWNTPYGLVRLGINKWRKTKGKESWWKQSLATEFQEQQRLKNALAGSAVLAALTGLGVGLLKTSGDDGAGDDDDDGIYFTGNGPKNKNLRSAWIAKGFKPQSLVVFLNGKPNSVEMSRSGEAFAHFAWLLAARDDRAWREKEATANKRPYSSTPAKETAYAIGTYFGLLGQRGIASTLTQAGNVASGQSDPMAFAASKGGSFIAGLFTPALGLQRSVQALMEGPVDTSSVQSAFMSNFPILNLMGVTHPKVNAFGDKLYNPENAWYHKMRDTGIPIAISTNPTTENKQLYGLLVEKGVAPRELRRANVEEKYGPLTDDQFAQLAERSGRLVKQQTVNNEPTLRKMTPAGVKKWLNSTSINAEKLTAMGMNLEPVNPPKTRTAAVQSILPAPAIYRSTASSPARRSYGRIRSSFGSRRRLTGGRVRRSLSLKVPRLKRSRILGIPSRRKKYGRVRLGLSSRR